MIKNDIDVTKIPVVMELIERAAELMEEKDCHSDKDAKWKLEELQRELREISGNKKLQVKDFKRYWSYTNLKTMAEKALMTPPTKSELTDAQIKEIVLNIMNHSEAEMDWWLLYLKINTGLDNLTDYIFYPELVGLNLPDTLELSDMLAQVADKIIADRH